MESASKTVLALHFKLYTVLSAMDHLQLLVTVSANSTVQTKSESLLLIDRGSKDKLTLPRL